MKKKSTPSKAIPAGHHRSYGIYVTFHGAKQ